ncbi:GTPase HflX [Halalkalibacterium ligniniphilum]|uniref:GTPase HflX n=1 Tax=Halalkalibacterium ligniniphilum TaxID=1134413 RepID=UPI00034C8D32|nr:GTPase HflX [Halalkalibacterium ligniniphilum]
MQEINRAETERVILVGCQRAQQEDERFEASMKELHALTETAKGYVIGTLSQKRDSVEPTTYIGRGKIEELVTLIEEAEIDVVIFNDELTGSQIRNLTRHCQVPVIDRTQLILDIFASRAKSREGKLQVELAQLRYSLPRLVGQGQALSRQGGGIGTRGPGETQLETDRRHIRRRMSEIERQLQTVVNHRERYRERRNRNGVLQIALVGYTNAGKSTLLNRLTEADTLEEDQLFATLDPTTRKFSLPSGMNVLLSDTVGFIQDLPTTLIAAFRSTLEEVAQADLLLHVVDSSNKQYDQHEETVNQLLKELEASSIPQLIVYNKTDQQITDFFASALVPSIQISAYHEGDLTKLKKKIEELLKKELLPYEAMIQSNEGKLLAQVRTETIVETAEWDEETEIYIVKGYVRKNSPLAKRLKEC